MNQNGTVESRVLDILRGCPRSRYDDMVLATHYYNIYGDRSIGKLPFEYVLFNYKRFGLPCFETIRRARQRVQSLFPDVSRNPKVDDGVDITLVMMVGG